jgi:hypothetical protein
MNPIRKSGVFLFFEIRGIVQLVVCVLWEHEVAGSSPATPTTGCERVWFKLLVLEASDGTRVVSSEGSNPSTLTTSGCSTVGYMGVPWKHVFAGSNPAIQTKMVV